jgi:hypothetical protein
MSVPPRLLPRVFTGIAALALFAAGCGGGGGSHTTTTTTPPVAITAPPPGASQLQAIVVQATDLPAGWTAKPGTPPADRVAATTAFAQCVGISSTASDVVALAYSPDYSSGSDTISSTAMSYRTRADVPLDAQGLLDPKASACQMRIDSARLSAGLAKGALKSYTEKITPGTGGGPANVVATATSSVVYVSAGHQVTLNDKTVYLAAPRIETRIDFYDLGKPVAATVEAAVVAKVAARVVFGS